MYRYSPAVVAHMTSDWRAIAFWLARRQRSTVTAVCDWLQVPELAECKPEKGPHHVFSQNCLIQKPPDGRLIRRTPDIQSQYGEY